VLESALSELVEARSRELESLADTDPLTGLFNVRYLRRHLAHLVGMQQRYGHPFALLLVDVDGLKRINVAYGEAVGDRALVSVGAAVRGTIRSIDTAVRLGGDEFCVLAPNQTAPRVRVLGERIADGIERLEPVEGTPVSVSVGVVSCPQHAVDAERLLELADEAMYRAKASGGRVAIAAGLTDAAGSESSSG
jgi:two-component system, cell cycle response regulator